MGKEIRKKRKNNKRKNHEKEVIEELLLTPPPAASDKAIQIPKRRNNNKSSQDKSHSNKVTRNNYAGGSRIEHIVGFLAASIFSMAYYVVPGWTICAIIMLIFSPFSISTWLVTFPILISALVPPIPMGWLLRTWVFQCVPKYFSYKEVLETPFDEINKLVQERPTILCLHPHGVFSMVALCSATTWSFDWWDPKTTKTAVADSILHVPLLKHIVGILGITGASAKPLIKYLNEKNSKGCILYPGGTSELFLSNPDHERLHLLDRKGFIRIALTQGCALIPGYLFGNTRVLKLLQWPILRWFSRRTGIAVTYFYGRFGLPLPLPAPTFSAIGKPILLPKIEQPTKEDINKWHEIYVHELKSLFNRYKKEAVGYENKVLELE